MLSSCALQKVPISAFEEERWREAPSPFRQGVPTPLQINHHHGVFSKSFCFFVAASLRTTGIPAFASRKS